MTRRSPVLVPTVQAIASLVILTLLLRQADMDELRQAFGRASMGWLAIAALTKALGLSLHELRLWVSLQPAHPRPIWAVMQLGYAAGLVNAVLPLRSGDVLAAVLLHKEQHVPPGAAVSAVGITALLEILAFGLFLLGVMVFGAVHFDALLGAATAARATSAVALVALGSLVAAVGAVVIAKGLGQAPAAPGVGPLAGLRAALRAAGEHLRHSGLALTNLGLAGGQVLSLVVIFWCLLPASGATPELPLLAVSGILAVGSLASIALPPSLGAAPAAVSVFVLGFFGVGEAQALTYAALTWVVNVVPALVLGAVPLWRRIGLLGELRGGDDRAPASER